MPTLERYLVISKPLPKMFSPLKLISPLVGSSSKFKHLSKVDLPEPEEPIMVTTSPGVTSSEISFKTR